MTRDSIDLFQIGKYHLHSGAISRFKIDCDALTETEIAALADQLANRLPYFREVEGIPNGGLRLAEHLKAYASGSGIHPLLIVDDVYTTGGSMETFRAGRPAIGGVLFARQPVRHEWITALFTMNPLP